MTRGPVDSGEPDRLYTVTGGRSRALDGTFGPATIVVVGGIGEGGEPAPGPAPRSDLVMRSEHLRILRLCRDPVSVAELSARLALPLGVVKILLGDLLAAGRISTRRPETAVPAPAPVPAVPPPLPDQAPPPSETLKKVLRALQNL